MYLWKGGRKRRHRTTVGGVFATPAKKMAFPLEHKNAECLVATILMYIRFSVY